MRRIKINKGDVFNKLVVLGEAKTRVTPKGQRKRYISCLCKCGRTTDIPLSNLRAKNPTRTCGLCEKGRWNATHRAGGTREHQAWTNMKTRCTNKKTRCYASYGGRGITICAEWKSFAVFLLDMGRCPDGYQIDRIDNSLGYSPENCHWVTRTENANNKRNNRYIPMGEASMRPAEIAHHASVTVSAIYLRLRNGWSGFDLLLPSGSRLSQCL